MIYISGRVSCILMKGMMVLLGPGLITFFVLKHVPHLFQMCIYTLRSDCILSNHFPLCFSIKANCTPRPTTPFNYSKSHRVNWSNVSHSDIEKYNDNGISKYF